MASCRHSIEHFAKLWLDGVLTLGEVESQIIDCMSLDEPVNDYIRASLGEYADEVLEDIRATAIEARDNPGGMIVLNSWCGAGLPPTDYYTVSASTIEKLQDYARRYVRS